MNPNRKIVLSVAGWVAMAGLAGGQIQLPPIGLSPSSSRAPSSEASPNVFSNAPPNYLMPLPPDFPKLSAEYPWFNSQDIPTDEERKALTAAREAAESDKAVIAATEAYAASFAAADERIWASMLKNPQKTPNLDQIKNRQQVHDIIWVMGMENSRDVLLPNPHADPDDPLAGIQRFKFSGFSNGLPASDSPAGIRRAAMQDAGAQAALQKVRDAYQALDAAARAAMGQNAAVEYLMKKYPNLLYGRRDLGFATGAFIQV